MFTFAVDEVKFSLQFKRKQKIFSEFTNESLYDYNFF